ncbi:MAG: hypothetical protein AAGE80_01310 [Pseudomonadota bacterium]
MKRIVLIAAAFGIGLATVPAAQAAPASPYQAEQSALGDLVVEVKHGGGGRGGKRGGFGKRSNFGKDRSRSRIGDNDRPEPLRNFGGTGETPFFLKWLID